MEGAEQSSILSRNTWAALLFISTGILHGTVRSVVLDFGFPYLYRLKSRER
jgi:hypothetical protein